MGQRKEQQWRMEGMSFCLRFLEQNNNDVEALKAEIKRRGAYGTPLVMSRSEEEAFCRKVRENTFDTVMIMTLAILHDKYGFGKKRTDEFMDYFQETTQLVADDCINWTELQMGVNSELYKNIHIRWHGQPPKGHV